MTLRCGNKPKFWNTIDIFVRRNSLNCTSSKSVTSCPSMCMFPEVESMRRIKHLTRVDLPLPDNPITTNVWPFATLNEMLRRATTCPNSDCISARDLSRFSCSRAIDGLSPKTFHRLSTFIRLFMFFSSFIIGKCRYIVFSCIYLFIPF